ncbi:YlbF family regulator [Alicyclobacillus cycloheptanicus]|uniref:Cell fate (Sporulation/competence/biofilm development) regulator YmcA (YheA/YmcA/DUF963 family) n=1 Tax=Alicyclobacillus cycloheptanicus TaxID=1457 RepID=A0ABT9XLN7_9BACL|nr:YlbF family regulator [Alicyclobacillus cycloheptanicus]MDQ0191227.1 cell fate (sporulation/competence/biofilm development) regulator YmcA (YheA/YmcA/DUF963 family) [Alicyclobacillus cycloheptanicus]WDM01535.1 YlbF family regulator [Alicyclobacillus cycloheptanicus]
MVDRNELWAEAEELADLIIQSPEIIQFKECELALKEVPEAQVMMAQLRELQEQIAEFQARRVPFEHYKHMMHDMESLLEKLENIPEVRKFQAAQSAVNDLLQAVTNQLAKAVLERVTGEVSGCSSGDC